jgi:hypothetical protein
MATRRSTRLLSLVALLAAGSWAPPGQGAVLFQNSGTTAGWDSMITQHIGTITEVASPVFKSATALRMEQTFQGLDGYHSEVRKHDAEKPGQDLYFGEALGLPPTWKYHDQNVTFQQFARSDVFGSAWALMFIQKDHLYLAHIAPGHADLGSVAGMEGKWIRIVTRLKVGSNGLVEVWVNGTKKLSYTGNVQPGPGLPVRWSVGMYCTYWRREQPAGLNPMVLYHDQMRVATTYEEADPASWDEGGPAPPPGDGGSADSGTPADAGAVETSADASADAATSPAPDAAPARPDAAAGGAAGAPGTDPSPETGGSGGSDPTRPPASHGGCGVGQGTPAAFSVALTVLLLALLLRRRPLR